MSGLYLETYTDEYPSSSIVHQGLTHTFKIPGGASRVLPEVQLAVNQLVDGFVGIGEAPGGFTDATGVISIDEFDAHPEFYVAGVEWIVTNDDDEGRVVWAGFLTDPQPLVGTVLLHADGTAKKADRLFNRWLWQTRDESEWSVADSEPLSYDTDPHIDAIVRDRTLAFKVKRGTVFRRPTGKARLVEDESIGNTTVKVDYSGGLEAGDNVTIGGEARVVAGSFTKGSQTIPLTSALTADHDAGVAVTWNVPGGRDPVWQSGLAYWAPTADLSRIAFDIEKDRNDSSYELQICTATGPDGNLTVVRTIQLSAGGGSHIVESLPGTPDLVLVRLRKTAEEKKARAFKVKLKNVRVNGMATGDVYTTDQVVADIAARIGGTTAGIQSSVRNAMPLDIEDGSAGEVLDELALLDDWYWGIEHNGTERAWRYGPWSTKTWVLTEPRARVELHPVARYGKVRVPFRYPGGKRHFKTYTAAGAPDTAETFQLDLQDPLPPEELADVLGPNIAEYLWETRFHGTATFLEVEDADDPGIAVPASRVRMGDRLQLANYDDRIPRIANIRYEDASSSDLARVLVTATFPEHHPLVKRLMKRRSLLLARGRGQASATLGGLGLADPLPPELVIGFEEEDIRGGRRAFNAVIDWDPITEDVDGNATAIRRYYIERRPVDPVTEEPIPRAQGGGRKGTWIKDADGGFDDVPTQALFERLAHPHKWKWQFQGYSEDVLGKMSAPSGWSDPAKPAAFGPPDPIGLVVVLKPKADRIEGDWDAPDPVELDDDGQPSLDRRIAHFEARLRRRLKANPGDPWVTYRGPKRVARRTEHAFKNIEQMGRHRWRYQVRSVDHYGNTSGWT